MIQQSWMTADVMFDENLTYKLKQKLHLIQQFQDGKNLSNEDEDYMYESHHI